MTTESDDNETRHRIFGFFRAPETAALWIILFIVGLFYLISHLGRDEDEPAPPEGPLRIEAQIEKSESGFQLSFQTDRPVYLSVFLEPKDARGSRIFPRLGPPRDLPWPLPAGETYLLPAAADRFGIPLASGDRLIVVARTDRLPDHAHDLDDDAEIAARLELEEQSP